MPTRDLKLPILKLKSEEIKVLINILATHALLLEKTKGNLKAAQVHKALELPRHALSRNKNSKQKG